MDRHIDFDAIENFRDFGGYATACGRGLKRGRLFRSAHHALATEADLERMRQLGVGAIVDLRQTTERRREPGRRWADFAGLVIENDIASSHDWVADLHHSPMTPEWFFETTRGHYRTNPFEPRLVELYRRFLRVVGEGHGAVVVHCAAGKDRTGLACALLHHIAGVGRDDMIADFLLTNDEARLDRKVQSAGDFIELETGRRPNDEALRVLAQVFPEFLDTAFQAIRDAHGTVDAYLEEVLGADAALRERIHDRVLG